MAGGKESEGRNLGVEGSERLRNVGIVIALLGLIGVLANIRFSGEVAVAGSILALTGQAGVQFLKKK